MSKVWYGSINNRIEENKMFCDEIKVGTGMTEYSYSDRDAYEVVEVKDQKHVAVREYDHKLKGSAYSNDWELISNENNPVKWLTKRGNYWYWTVTIDKSVAERATNESLSGDDRIEAMLFLGHNNLTPAYFETHDKATRYHRANVSFGVADYYYDYEF